MKKIIKAVLSFIVSCFSVDHPKPEMTILVSGKGTSVKALALFHEECGNGTVVREENGFVLVCEKCEKSYILGFSESDCNVALFQTLVDGEERTASNPIVNGHIEIKRFPGKTIDSSVHILHEPPKLLSN